MSRKAINALVFFLAVVLTTVPVWSATPGHIGLAASGKIFSTKLKPVAADLFKIENILARGGNGGGNGGQGGNGNGFGGGDQGGHGNGFGGGVNGGHGDGDCDGSGDGLCPGPDAGPGPGGTL